MLVWDLRSSNLTSFGFLSNFGNAAMLTFLTVIITFYKQMVHFEITGESLDHILGVF